MNKSTQELLQAQVIETAPSLPSSVFQFDFNSSDAESFLQKHLEIPFLIRKSSVEGAFALDAYQAGTGSFSHVLIIPSSDNKVFELYNYVNGVKTPVGTLTNQIENIRNAHQKAIEEKNKNAFNCQMHWHMLKEKLNQIPEKNRAVMSIQSLDQKKIVLTAEQLDEYAQVHPEVKDYGDGHTGFAIAKVLKAPFAVIRSEGNRNEVNAVLKNHLANNGLLVITGHGIPDGKTITGNYVNLGTLQKAKEQFSQSVTRGTEELVRSAMEAGLKNGDHITLLLCICFAAADTSNKGNSFAHLLAREFAKQGISTYIVASDKPVSRFGSEVIEDNCLTFNDKIGIAPEDVCVLTTEVEGPTTTPEVYSYKPNERIQLSPTGMRFLNLHNPALNLHSLKMEPPSEPIATPPTPVITPLTPVATPMENKSAPVKHKMNRAQNTKTSPPETDSEPIKLYREKLKLRIVTEVFTKAQEFEQGIAKKINYIKAIELYNQAIRFKHPDAQKSLDRLLTKIKSYKSESRYDNLFKAIQKMHDYGESLSSLKADKGIIAIDLAKQLEDKVINFLLKADKMSLTENEINQFKSSFKKLLHSQDPVMHHHRQQWKPILANILIALTGIGLLALIANTAVQFINASRQNKPLTFNQCLFFAKTKSQLLGDTLEESLNATPFQPAPRGNS